MLTCLRRAAQWRGNVAAGRRENVAAGRRENVTAGRRENVAAGRRENITASRRGNVAVEFALIAPVLMIFIIGVFDVSKAMLLYQQVYNAAHTI